MLFLLLLVGYGCEEDDETLNITPQKKPNLSFDKINLKEDDKLRNHLLGNARLSTFFELNTPARSNAKMVHSIISQIDTTEIIRIANESIGRYRYTVLLEDYKQEALFSNLVLEVDKGSIEFFIFSYEPEEKWLLNADASLDMTNYTGSVKVYDLEENIIAESYMENGVNVGQQKSNGRVKGSEECNFELVRSSTTGMMFLDIRCESAGGFILELNPRNNTGNTDYSYQNVPNHMNYGTSSGGTNIGGSGGGGSGTATSTTGSSTTTDCQGRDCEPQNPVGIVLPDRQRIIAEKWESRMIDDSQLKPCMKNILNDLKQLNQGVGQIISKFAGNAPGFNWKVIDGKLKGTTNAATSPLYNNQKKEVTTTFDSREFGRASDLSVARTILHESVHAYLVVVQRTDISNFNKTYGQMMQDWFAAKKPKLNDIHHEEMVRSFVKDIGDALEEYGKNKGYSLPTQFYQDLAWGGLTDTKAFKKLSPSIRERIQEIIQVESDQINRNGNYQKSKGNNAGC